MIPAAASTTTRERAVAPGWWVLAGWLGLVALHLWIARGVNGPIVLQDESGYLGNARWLIGRSPVPEMGDAPVYAWGYSVVIAPVVALFSDPSTLYRAVQVVNSLLLASLLPLLWRLLRDVGGLAPRRAALAALAGSVFPATLVHSSTAWSESLVPVLTTILALAVWWTVTDRSWWQRAAVAPVAVALYASHPRFLPVLALVVIGLLAAVWQGRAPRLVGMVGVSVAIAGWIVVRLVDAALLDARWPDRVADEGSASRLLRRLADPTNLPEIVAGSIGQAWYLAAGSFGLAVAGVLTIGWWVRRVDEPERRLAVIAMAVVVVALFVTSVVSFVGTAERVDHHIYGRYNEAFVPLLVAVGAAGFLHARSLGRLRLVTWSGLATGLLGGVLMVIRGPNGFSGEVVWNNILGVRLAVELGTQRWVVVAATLMAVAALGSAWLVARLNRPLALAGLVVALAASGVVAVGPLADFSRVTYDGWRLPDDLGRITDAVEVDGVVLHRAESSLMAVHGYPFWSPHLRFAYGRPGDGDRPDLVVAMVRDSNLAEDALIAALDGRNGQAVWVPSGTPAFERLSELGAVLPRGFPTELPRSAQSAAVELAPGSSATIELGSGASASIEVDVRHAGQGYAWPSDAEWPLPGVVRVGARWFDRSGELVGDQERGPLPAVLWPGDRATVRIALRAADQAGAGLPTGTYEVRIGMVQEGFAWFADDGADSLSISVVVS